MVAELRTETPAEHGRAYSILITDDDRGSRETLAGLLADRGFQTLQASSGEEAIDIVRVELVHLAIFDMHMPRMTGLGRWSRCGT
jgi:CheY-like chemotaxis protein